MRRGHRDARDCVGMHGGVEQRDRAAIAVAEQDGPISLGIDAKRGEQRGQYVGGLAVHEVDRALSPAVSGVERP